MTGGGSGGQASPPQLNVNQSAQLLNRQLGIYNRQLPRLAQTAGDASRKEYGSNTAFGLQMLTNPAQALYGADAKEITDRNKGTQKQIAELRGKLKGANPKQRARLNNRIAGLEDQITSRNQQASALLSRDPVAELTGAFGQEFANRDRLLADMEAARVSTPEYQRMQEAFGRGVSAQETESGALGNQLMQRAMDKVAQGGQLSPEASRDAVQAARAGMASRGMATGSAGLAAEMLNRDRFARAREMENLNFARGVQTEDLTRRQTNTTMRADTDRFNIGLLGQSAGLADAERARQLGLGQDAYNFGLSTNPRMMLAGLGSPYANMTGNAMQMVGGANGLNPMYSGGKFSSGGMGGALMGGGMGALSGALSGAALGSVVPGIGTALGAGIGALAGGATGFMGGSR